MKLLLLFLSLFQFLSFHLGNFSDFSFSINKQNLDLDQKKLSYNSNYISWNGRHFVDDANAVTWFNYAFSSFAIKFNGTYLDGDFVYQSSSIDDWAPYIEVYVDNLFFANLKIGQDVNGTSHIRLVSLNDAGLHEVKIYKCTDGGYSSIGLKELNTDGSFILNNDTKNGDSVLFIGDHISLGDFTTGEKNNLVVNSNNSNCLNSYIFDFYKNTKIPFDFIGCHYLPVLKSKDIDSGFEFSCAREIILYDYFHNCISTINNLNPSFIVINLGMSDHSYYESLDSNLKDSFLIQFENEYISIIELLLSFFSNAKIILMSGMVRINDNISNIITSVCSKFEGKAYRLISKSRGLGENMIGNMPTLGMHEFAAKEIEEKINNITNNTEEKNPTFDFVSLASTLFIIIVLPSTIYLMQSRRKEH